MNRWMRGTYELKNVIDKDVIIAHIKSYNPVVSHYRREHAPHKLYLPSDTTLISMHHSSSFETYHRVLRELNITFARLGNEECEQCALFKSHEDRNECSKDPSSCG
ncbi:unnamed protein product [Euphydryas editha]|uniref:Uncharacterized protein n=1 Tax=Euphydryas editha TaxID=104508 RepID=A0AAU9UTQ6_EUPED|nr:unnamed protein product [Euphydryas editha]